MQEIDYDALVPEEQVVRFRGKVYLLRAASARAVADFNAAVVRAAKPGPDGKATVFDGITTLEYPLLSHCLREQESGQPVPVKELEGWPNQVIADLFERVKQLSGMGDGEDTLEALAREQEALDRRRKALPSGETPTGNSFAATGATSR